VQHQETSLPGAVSVDCSSAAAGRYVRGDVCCPGIPDPQPLLSSPPGRRSGCLHVHREKVVITSVRTSPDLRAVPGPGNARHLARATETPAAQEPSRPEVKIRPTRLFRKMAKPRRRSTRLLGHCAA
jgi:hypothetical protein